MTSARRLSSPFEQSQVGQHADPIKSVDSNGALRLALQRCETGRLVLLLGLLGASLVLASLRHVAGGKAMQGQMFVLALVLIGLSSLYAIALLIVARRASQRGYALPTWVWAVSLVLECSIPTAGILLLQNSGRVSRLEALTAPAVLMYGAIIALSILRVRPWLCLLAGLVAAVGHAGLFARAAAESTTPLGSGEYPYYLSYSVNLLITGAAAAMVAGAVRGYFLSSLREADARAELAGVRKSLEIARQIQQSLLPREGIHVAGYEVAAWNRSADETGGDYYDWFRIPDGRMAVVIADVTGHGVGPAMLMAVCRAYARASVPNMDPLRAAIVQLNRLVSHDFGDGRFVTFAVALLSPDHDEIELLSAGHGPTLVCRRSGGAIETFDGDGLPLGIMPEADFTEPRKIRMERGDALLLVTDGFMEAHNAAGDLFGISRLSDSLAANAEAPITEIVNQMDSEVRSFAGTQPQADDMTAVIIRRTA